MEREYRELEAMPELIARVVDDLETIDSLARGFAPSSTVLFLGPHVGYPVARRCAQAQGMGYLHA